MHHVTLDEALKSSKFQFCELASHISTLAWEIQIDRQNWGATAHGVTKSRTQLNV